MYYKKRSMAIVIAFTMFLALGSMQQVMAIENIDDAQNTLLEEPDNTSENTDEHIEDNGIHYRLNKDILRATVIHYSGVSTDVVVPRSITVNDVHYIVGGIEREAFSNTQLTSLVLPHTLIPTGTKACTNTESIVVFINGSMVTIDLRMFMNHISESIQVIDNNIDNFIIVEPSLDDTNHIHSNVTLIGDGSPCYDEEVSLHNTVTIGENLSFMAIAQIKFVHDNDSLSWNEHKATVQWFKNDEPIEGANELQYTLQNIKEDDEGVYYAVIDGQKLDNIEVKVVTNADTIENEQHKENNPDVAEEDTNQTTISNDLENIILPTENISDRIYTGDQLNLLLYSGYIVGSSVIGLLILLVGRKIKLIHYC